MTCGVSTVWEFYPGSTDRLNINLKTKTSDGCEEIFALEVGDVLTVSLPTSIGDLEFVDPRVVVESLPYGSIYVDLLAAETEQLVSGTIQIKIVRGAEVKFAFVKNGISKLNLSSC